VNPPERPNFEKGEERVSRLYGWYDSDFCVITSWEGWVRLFSLSCQRVVTEFFTRKNPCGINVVVSSDNKRCFVSPGYTWGIGCFETETGELVWKWKGPSYRLSFCPASNSLYAFARVGRALRFDPSTGSLRESFRGIREIFPSQQGSGVLTIEAKSIRIRDSAMRELFSLPKESWAVLDVAWSEISVAISDVRTVKPDGTRTGIRCYDLRTGEFLWSYVGRRGHVRPLMYRPARKAFVGVDFRAGPDERLLLQWDERSGKIIHEETIAADLHGELCARGELMFLADCKTHATSVLRIE
jgi:WD40 repeat protein